MSFSVRINLTPACCTTLPQRNSQTHAQKPASRCLEASTSAVVCLMGGLKRARVAGSLLCHPLIRIIKLSQPAAHKWGISPAPPSCRDSLQIASDSPPDCAMIMLSLDAVIMMAHNCWCALAAAQRPPISLSTCLCIYRPPLCLYVLLFFFPFCVTTRPQLLSFFSSLIQPNAQL